MRSIRQNRWRGGVLALVFGLSAAAFLLAGCGTGGSAVGTSGKDPCAGLAPAATVTPGAAGHLVYQRIAAGPLPAKDVWRPGETQSYQWCAYPIPAPQGQGDAQEQLTLSLEGPYATRADAQAAQSQTGSLPPAIVTTQPITTDTWSATVLTSTLQLPASLVSGYYVVFADVTLGNTTTQGSNAAPSSGESQIIQVAD